MDTFFAVSNVFFAYAKIDQTSGNFHGHQVLSWRKKGGSRGEGGWVLVGKGFRPSHFGYKAWDLIPSSNHLYKPY